ncbi:unnamed protein product, partial [Laminaria digitata]
LRQRQLSGTFSQGTTAARDLPLQRSASTPSPGIASGAAGGGGGGYGFQSAGGDDSSCESEGASDTHPDRYDDNESPGPSSAFVALAAMIPVINPVGIGQEAPPVGFGQPPGVKMEEGRGPPTTVVSMPRSSASASTSKSKQ